jgi:hypothetical protein
MKSAKIKCEQTKPRFKRFEMHGNLPTILQHGTVVSASKPEEVDRYTTRTELERAQTGCAMTVNTRKNNECPYKRR